MEYKNKKIFFFLGLGLGIILVNILYSIKPNDKLTEEEIIKEAKNLGMVFLKDKIELDNRNTLEDSLNKEEIKDDNLEISIKIKDGESLSDITKKLIDKEIIKSEEEFKRKAFDLNMEKKLKTGEFYFKKGESYEEIIKKLTKED